MEKTAHQIGVKIQWDDYTREKLGKNEELQIWITTQWLDVRLKKKQQEMDEAVGQLKLQEEKNRIAVAELRERAQILAGQDIKTLIALLPDNAQRTQLLELFRQTQAAGMGPGQILALQAGASPAVADALARMSEVRREDLEREFAERKKLSDDSAARLERVLTEALRAMAEQSKSRVQVNMPGPMV
jgi:selenocysteine-specific translation elongation factor